MSFEAGFSSYQVEAFPRQNLPLLPLIAPLWADFNFRDSGNVFYRIDTNMDTLDRVAEIIANSNPIYGDFRPTMAVVVTWFQGRLLRSVQVVRLINADIKLSCIYC